MARSPSGVAIGVSGDAHAVQGNPMAHVPVAVGRPALGEFAAAPVHRAAELPWRATLRAATERIRLRTRPRPARREARRMCLVAVRVRPGARRAARAAVEDVVRLVDAPPAAAVEQAAALRVGRASPTCARRLLRTTRSSSWSCRSKTMARSSSATAPRAPPLPARAASWPPGISLRAPQAAPSAAPRTTKRGRKLGGILTGRFSPVGGVAASARRDAKTHGPVFCCSFPRCLRPMVSVPARDGVHLGRHALLVVHRARGRGAGAVRDAWAGVLGAVVGVVHSRVVHTDRVESAPSPSPHGRRAWFTSAGWQSRCRWYT